MSFNGIVNGLGDLSLLSRAKTRSICAENPTGEKGGGAKCAIGDGVSGYAASRLGVGWKVNPYVVLPPHSVVTLADIEGPGCIQHIWCTPTGAWREQILRIYWDDQDHPSVESPVGDFFACGLEQYAQVSSLPIAVNPGSSFNCYWNMPFRQRARFTVENRSSEERTFFYQIDYCLTEVPEEAAYFHARFNRVNPLPYKEVYPLLDGVRGRGHYVGTYMCWGVNNNGWWGEGEFKFYLDGDGEHPTICGTGTEDYFGGSYNFELQTAHCDPQALSRVQTDRYQTYSTPFCGMVQVTGLDAAAYNNQRRFSLYRFHVTDPIRFESDLRVTAQALGWRPDKTYLPLQDDLSSVAYWYQSLPSVPFPPLPDRDYLELI